VNNVGAVNGAAVPSVSSGVSSLDKNSVGALVIGGNGNSLVEKMVEVFDSNSFMIPTSSDIDINVEKGTDGLKEALEGASIIDNNQPAETNFRRTLWTKRQARLWAVMLLVAVTRTKPVRPHMAFIRYASPQ
jgi:hypothetical protein